MLATNRYWSLLRTNPDFRRLYLAQIISFGGDWFLTVPLLGLIYEMTGSAAATGAILAVQSLPTSSCHRLPECWPTDSIARRS
jgi:hypothetical protein